MNRASGDLSVIECNVDGSETFYAVVWDAKHGKYQMNRLPPAQPNSRMHPRFCTNEEKKYRRNFSLKAVYIVLSQDVQYSFDVKEGCPCSSNF